MFKDGILERAKKRTFQFLTHYRLAANRRSAIYSTSAIFKHQKIHLWTCVPISLIMTTTRSRHGQNQNQRSTNGTTAAALAVCVLMMITVEVEPSSSPNATGNGRPCPQHVVDTAADAA
jgi:hypothetical protein